MKGAVVFQSKFGNSRQIAEQITGGLREVGHEVELLRVGSFKELPADIEFVVVGGPTRVGRAYGPIKRFARKVTDRLSGKPYATFSTGASVYGGKPSRQAAEVLDAILEAGGMKRLSEPLLAGVSDMSGPLSEGELDRAAEYGRALGRALGDGSG